jgi:hypothetical protein
MIKRILPLVLLAAWIPQAHAFPPCPLQPMELAPADSVAPQTPDTDAELWFKASYQLVGHPTVVDQIDSPTSPTSPSTGKCRDRDALPLPDTNTSAGTLQLNPVYAPKSGFGMVDLPYLPLVAVDGLRVEYRLRFAVENRVFVDQGDWVDLLQLDFFRSDSTETKYPNALSSVYRLRKAQRNNGFASIEVVESRDFPGDIDIKPPLIDRVVASIPLQNTSGQTVVALRWTQAAKGRAGDGTIQPAFNPPSFAGYDIDTTLEVLGPNDAVLYSVLLRGEWASTFSMGLLDYNVGDATAFAKSAGVELSDMSFTAIER